MFLPLNSGSLYVKSPRSLHARAAYLRTPFVWDVTPASGPITIQRRIPGESSSYLYRCESIQATQGLCVLLVVSVLMRIVSRQFRTCVLVYLPKIVKLLDGV
jgi:hypothetical protein